jgi:glycosyltransferase involved in cell wall biosynthesis
MNIVVNARFLCTSATGVQRFAFEVSRYLKRFDPTICFVCPSNIHQHAWAEELDAKIIGHLQGHLWEQISLPTFLSQHKDAILFSPSNTGTLFVKRQLLVLHDVAFIVNPAAFNWKFRLYYRTLMHFLTNQVARILTVSDFSRKEISRFYPKAHDKIHVTYNGITRFPRNLAPYVGVPYFLVVGSLDPRKNIPFIIKVYSQLPVQQRPALKIVGGKGKSFRQENFGPIPSGVEFLGHAGDDMLARLYANAKALLFPSLYEGFGLPPVEAMSFGTPTLVSNIPVLHETLQDAAIFLDPHDEQAWLDAMTQIISDKDLATSLKQKGLRQSQKFSWEISARQIYQHLQAIPVDTQNS